MITRPIKGPQLIDTITGKFLVKVPYPVAVTPKLDGIRAVVVGHKTLSAKMEPIPNKWIAYKIAELCPNGFDGEIITYTEGRHDDFNTVQSKVMSEDGKPDFVYHVFDWESVDGYMMRTHNLAAWCADARFPACVQFVMPRIVRYEEALLLFEKQVLKHDYEGVMLRALTSPYKNGRSTLNEFYLVKMKRFLDSEAVVLEFIERKHNANPAFTGKVGQTKRRSCKENLEATGTLGSFVAKDCNPDSPHYGQTFKCGMRLNNTQKKAIWDNRSKFIGKTMTYKYQESKKTVKPRFPVFYRWRIE